MTRSFVKPSVAAALLVATLIPACAGSADDDGAFCPAYAAILGEAEEWLFVARSTLPTLEELDAADLRYAAALDRFAEAVANDDDRQTVEDFASLTRDRPVVSDFDGPLLADASAITEHWTDFAAQAKERCEP